MDPIPESEEPVPSRPATNSRLPPLGTPRLDRTPQRTPGHLRGLVRERSELGPPIQEDEEPKGMLITEIPGQEAEVMKIVHDEQDEEAYEGDSEQDSAAASEDKDSSDESPSYCSPLPRLDAPVSEEGHRAHKTPDIFEDDGWDTDLEPEAGESDGEFKDPEHDITGRNQYARMCEAMGVVPVSYFMRHIQDQHLVMRCHGLGVQGTRAIARALKENVHVEKLDLTGNWMEPEGGYFIAKMLKENDFITEVNLAENKLCSEGTDHLLQMLHSNITLTSIDLSGNDIEDRDAEPIAEMLEKNKFLSSLYLAKNNFGSSAGLVLGPAIGDNAILETLDLSWNRLRGPGAEAVAAGVKENVRLKQVNLSWNGFGPVGGLLLAEVVVQNHTILELDISGNRLDCACATSIGKGLLTNDMLQVLKMGNNPITTYGALKVLEGARGNESSSLVVLDLADIPVERVFLETKDLLLEKRPEVDIRHGPVLMSGNTSDDIGQPQRDPTKRDPLVILEDAIKVRDLRLIEVLLQLDETNTHSVTQAQFIQALQELGVSFSKPQLEQIVKKLQKTKEGRISFEEFVHLVEERKTPP